MNNQKRVNEIKSIYTHYKKYFGKRVLDIACGGGVLGFIIEPKGHEYLGVDVNPDMIKGAKEYATKIKSRNKFLLRNIVKSKVNGRFDTISLIGNSLAHFTTFQFVKVLGNLPTAEYFIIDYRDVVEILSKKQWKDKMIEKRSGKKYISLTEGFNTESGEIYKSSSQKDKSKKIEFIHTIWSPFILEPMMNLKGWQLVKRKKENVWHGWMEVYKK